MQNYRNVTGNSDNKVGVSGKETVAVSRRSDDCSLILKACIVLSPLLLGGCIFVHRGDAERPAQTSDALLLPETRSSVVLPVTLDAAVLQEKANQMIPQRLVEQDWKNKNSCIPAKYAKVCVGAVINGKCIGKWVKTKVTPAIDCKYSAKVDRGPIKLTSSNGGLKGEIPLKIQAKVRGRGELGSRIQLDPKGSLLAKLSTSVDIDRNYKPAVDLGIDYSWKDFAHVWALGFKIRLDDNANKEIDKQIAKIDDTVTAVLSQTDFRSKAARAWSGLGKTHELGDNSSFVRVTPMEIGFATPRSVGNELDFRFYTTFVTQAFVGTERPANPEPLPLPPLSKTQFPDGFDLNMPISIAFSELERRIKESADPDKWIVSDVDGLGRVKAKLLDVEFFQTTSQQFVLGVKMQADIPGRIFDAKGWLWAPVTFNVDRELRQITVDQIEFKSNLDNWAVNTLVKIANLELVRSQIQSKLKYDFSKEYDIALKSAQRLINRPLDADLALQGKVEEIDLRWVGASPNSLVLNANAKGSIAVTQPKP